MNLDLSCCKKESYNTKVNRERNLILRGTKRLAQSREKTELEHKMDEPLRIVDFERPPVVETALGFQFAPISGWTLLHHGLFWAKIRDQYPKAEVKSPVGNIEPDFVAETELTQMPVRSWFIDSSDTQLIQVQQNVFIRNWRKTEQTLDYEHYDKIKPLFKRDWNIFLEFLQAENLPKPQVWHCEVTYINHLLRDGEWKTYVDIPKLFPAWSISTGNEPLRSLKMVSFANSYELPDNQGRLQITAQPGVRKSDGREIIQLTLTASGQPLSTETEDLFNWLDIGHKAVVTSFKEFTSEEMHRYWRMK